MRRLTFSPGLRAGGSRAGRILVAVDFGAPSLAAARWVAHQLAPQAELVLAHVLPVPDAPAFLREHLRSPEPFVHAVAGPMRGGLEGLATTLGSPRIRLELRVGEPAEQLAELAAAYGVDLICVGRPRHRGDTVKLGRNTVDRLLRLATVPVLQATGSLEAAPGSVLAAVDGGTVSERVLRHAWALAARLESPLTALHVLDDDVRAYVRAMEVAIGEPAKASAAEEALWGTTAAWLRDVLESSGARPGRSHAMVSAGDPGQEVLAACKQAGAGLLVVGRSGRDARAPQMVGSTTRLVMRAASCPVLVVPEAAVPLTPVDGGSRRSRAAAPALRAASAPALRAVWADAAHGDDGGGVPPAAHGRLA